jgi:hypothetical protein
VWDGHGSSGTPITVVFAADHAWAGEVEPVVQVHTAASGASCGYTFEEGSRYVVLGRRTGDYVETGLCSLTQPYNRDVIAQFEPITGRGGNCPASARGWPQKRIRERPAGECHHEPRTRSRPRRHRPPLPRHNRALPPPLTLPELVK